MPERELVTQQALLDWMNERLAQHEDMDDCRIEGPLYRLRQPAGCNWSDRVTIRTSGRSATDRDRHVVEAVVLEARTRFNLAEED